MTGIRRWAEIPEYDGMDHTSMDDVYSRTTNGSEIGDDSGCFGSEIPCQLSRERGAWYRSGAGANLPACKVKS